MLYLHVLTYCRAGVTAVLTDVILGSTQVRVVARHPPARHVARPGKWLEVVRVVSARVVCTEVEV